MNAQGDSCSPLAGARSYSLDNSPLADARSYSLDNSPLADARSYCDGPPDSRGHERQRVDQRSHPDSPPESRSHERQRVDHGKRQKHLPRLPTECYRGHAFVHWTPTIEERATGWLTSTFHQKWHFCLLHTCARYHLACPAYVLMPDHMHLIWLGLSCESDQRLAIEFLRRQLRPALSPAVWQQQAHDHLLRDEERKCSAFINVANYILENPVRAELARSPADYPFLGCCVPGYPELDVRTADYWERFWRVYNYLKTP